tara:strand:+ start:3355 stop:3798 length:444 start_codon:yes stop_codon:yes gene_type:complete
MRLPLFILCILAIHLTGCRNTTSTKYHQPKAQAPKSSVNSHKTFKAARVVETSQEGRSTGVGHGSSMAPLYSDNTVLVIHPIDYEDLEPGMIVAYRHSSGNRVVHRLIRKKGIHWISAGLNNIKQDQDLVTPRNLIGVVYASFQAKR